MSLPSSKIPGLAQPSAATPTPDQLFQQGLAHHREGRLPEAMRLYEQALKARPKFFDALHMLGVASYQAGQADRAVDLITRAIELRPQIPQAYNNLGNALVVAGRRPEAVKAYERAVQIKPDYAEAFYNAGCVLYDLEDVALAATCYDKAIEIEPRHLQAYLNRGLAFQRINLPDLAADNYRAALRVAPQNAELHFMLGQMLFELRDFQGALTEYGLVQAAQPDMPYLCSNLLHTRAHLCDWTDWQASVDKLGSLIRSGNPRASHPFHVTNCIDDPALQRRLAQDRVATHHNKVLARPPLPAPDGRIRVGFFSADFHAHPVSLLLLEFIETHNRERFEFIAFSFRETDDAVRARLKAAFDRFIDVESMGDAAVASLARETGLHLAIDLSGYTSGGRMNVFAERAAPVQASYLGYPGTTGAPFMDYLIADPQVIPQEDEVHYTERVVRLPHAILPRDSRARPSGVPLTRSQFGLPEDGMVYCCFNNNVKFIPEMFALWMQVLAQVPGSVLWLPAVPPQVRANLLAAVESANIESSRLVFAERMDRLEDHLQRLTLADLFLDTWPYNAHTTAGDALFVGLPVLTRMGRTFAARVAGSLLTTLGVSELITHTAEDYVRLAVDLGHDRAARQALRSKVEARRDESPLFDSAAYGRALEDLLASLAACRLPE